MICVSIGRSRHRHVMAEHRHLVEQGAKLVELRLDYIRGDVNLKRLLADRPCPVLVTFRREADGGKWQGTEDPRVWKTAKRFPSPKHGEYAYGNTYAKKLEPGPKIGSIVTVRPILVRKFKADGVVKFSWMFPNLREIDPSRSAPDTASDMERIARESAARTPGKKVQMQIMELLHEGEG